MSDLAYARNALLATFNAGSGRIKQFARAEGGSVASVTEAAFDLVSRRATMHHRFLVAGDDDADADDLIESQTSMVEGDLLHLERPGDPPEWTTVEVPWPSSSPVLAFYWLRGMQRVHRARDSISVAGARVLLVELSIAQAIESSDPADRPGVRASFDEAGLVGAEFAQVEVVISASQVIRSVPLPFPVKTETSALSWTLTSLASRSTSRFQTTVRRWLLNR